MKSESRMTKEVTTISDLRTWTLTLVYVGWCYGGYHGDAVHVETAALDRNCRRACAEIYTGHQFQRRREKGGWVVGEGNVGRGLTYLSPHSVGAVKNELVSLYGF